MKQHLINGAIAFIFAIMSTASLANDLQATATSDVHADQQLQTLPATAAGRQPTKKQLAEARREEMRALIRNNNAASAMTLVGF